MPSIKTLLKPLKNPYESLLNNPNQKSLFNFFSTQLPNPISYPIKPKNSTKNNRPLDVVFKEALGFYEKEETFDNFRGRKGVLKKNLLDLEMEIKQLKGNGKDGVFSNPNSKTLNEVKIRGRCVELGKVYKEISQDMQLLLRHLYDCGYFKDVYISPGNRFDLNCFYQEFAHDYVKNALKSFGNDKKEISKWLLDSDVKSIALFGCPSLNKEYIKAAKYLRSFLKISEESVCSGCVLNDTCKYRNIRKSDISTLRLDSLLRLLRAYSLEEVSPKLKLTDDMKARVSRLIHEVIKLSKVLMT
ncbi:uncharacterized protein LOC141656322 [Silene latifolia]|uniref:uncharacterized protein LOC141656322 n=1 Tax=Silene latifolia TaxID=37657 RepID=UPI003D77FE31